MTKWTQYKGDAVQADLLCAGKYVISCRENCFTVSWRPKGHHEHVGQFSTKSEAIAAAERHFKKRKAPPDWFGCGKVITQESWDGFLAARKAGLHNA